MERTYPAGVTCWIDLTTPDVAGATAFYGHLLGWTFADLLPADAPDRYVLASLDGADAAAIASGPGPASWSTYVAVDDADAATRHLSALGFDVEGEPADAGPGGRTASLRDPAGAEVRLWQARRRLGAQVVNQPGAWNFSDLHTPDVDAAARLYSDAFGWQVADQGWSTSIRVPGYGNHLEATVDPDIRVRQSAAPEGFADVVGGIRATAEGEPPHWHVTFAVADRDASVAIVRRHGGEVLTIFEDDWVRAAVVRDPGGAVLTLSQFAPAEWD